ncbi:MAG: hypothetical protein JWO80_123 [Bryobacterales bacterium]|nr:hypothetical protein [Bryobacterales bacterium]
MHLDESPAADLWRRTLSQIPTLFGRLVYLASLRDPNTGLYQHFGFAQRFSDREADKTMRRSHVNVFADWLNLSLEEQRGDLSRYLGSLEGEKERIVANWTRFPPFAGFIPSQAREGERNLFLDDMRIMLELLRKDYSSASSGPDA